MNLLNLLFSARNRNIHPRSPLIIVFILTVFILAVTSPALAMPMPAFEWTLAQPLDRNAAYSVGFLFQITSEFPFWVTHLGVYDSDRNGLKESHEIGLWHDDGTSLFGIGESYDIGPSNTNLEGHFRYVEIASPIRLDPGKYVVAASWQTGDDRYPYGPINDFTETFQNVKWRRSAFAEGSDLTFPDTYYNAIGLFGANLKLSLEEPNPVPEPHTMFLLGIGLIGLAGLGKWRIKKK